MKKKKIEPEFLLDILTRDDLEAHRRVLRVVTAAKKVPDLAFSTLVARLARYAMDSKTGRHIFRRIHAELSNLESKQPVRKSDLHNVVVLAYLGLRFLSVYGESISNTNKPPTYKELYSRVLEITGWLPSDKLERNIRFVADKIPLEITKWKGS
jgi:hypothetical protein